MPDRIEPFLSAIGLADLVPVFQAAGLDREALLALPDARLEELGISPGDRARIRAAASACADGFAPDASEGWRTTSSPWEATREAPFVNCLGMLFVPIPRYRTLFSICLVRVCDYESYCRKVGRPLPACDFTQGLDHPVVNVTWKEATAFCDWITRRERERGIIDQALVYRLPTDPEWSAAVGLPEEPGANPKARSGRCRGYPWGQNFPPPRGVGNYSPALRVDDFPETSPVASFPPNSLGIYDLGGNVWEWCMDFYEPGERDRTARGASCFNNGEDYLRSSHRDHVDPNRCRNNVGFRVVLSEHLYKDPLRRVDADPWTV